MQNDEKTTNVPAKQDGNVEVKYGRVRINGVLCGTANYKDETGSDIVLISPPYKPLRVIKDGTEIKAQPIHVMMWTAVAGWLGTAELAALAKVCEER